jgi:putative DNA methylase
MAENRLSTQIGRQITLPGHFDVPVLLEDVRALVGDVELDGQKGLSTGRHALVEKKKGKYRLRDFAERGEDEKLGLPPDGGAPAPLIDAQHRILWLVENQPRNLNRFLDEARPDRERLRLVAQTLAGTALAGKKDNGPEHTVATTAAEQAALKKLVANWRALIDQRLTDLPLFQEKGS